MIFASVLGFWAHSVFALGIQFVAQDPTPLVRVNAEPVHSFQRRLTPFNHLLFKTDAGEVVVRFNSTEDLLSFDAFFARYGKTIDVEVNKQGGIVGVTIEGTYKDFQSTLQDLQRNERQSPFKLEAKLDIRKGSGTYVRLSQAEGEAQMRTLARTSQVEEAWIFVPSLQA